MMRLRSSGHRRKHSLAQEKISRQAVVHRLRARQKSRQMKRRHTLSPAKAPMGMVKIRLKLNLLRTKHPMPQQSKARAMYIRAHRTRTNLLRPTLRAILWNTELIGTTMEPLMNGYHLQATSRVARVHRRII